MGLRAGDGDRRRLGRRPRGARPLPPPVSIAGRTPPTRRSRPSAWTTTGPRPTCCSASPWQMGRRDHAARALETALVAPAGLARDALASLRGRPRHAARSDARRLALRPRLAAWRRRRPCPRPLHRRCPARAKPEARSRSARRPGASSGAAGCILPEAFCIGDASRPAPGRERVAVPLSGRAGLRPGPPRRPAWLAAPPPRCPRPTAEGVGTRLIAEIAARGRDARRLGSWWPRPAREDRQAAAFLAAAGFRLASRSVESTSATLTIIASSPDRSATVSRPVVAFPRRRPRRLAARGARRGARPAGSRSAAPGVPPGRRFRRRHLAPAVGPRRRRRSSCSAIAPSAALWPRHSARPPTFPGAAFFPSSAAVGPMSSSPRDRPIVSPRWAFAAFGSRRPKRPATPKMASAIHGYRLRSVVEHHRLDISEQTS